MADLTVGFIGVGDMGGAIVERIVDRGFDTMVWARRPESLEQFAGQDFTIAASVGSLGTKCDIVGVCVFDDADVREVVSGPDGLLQTMRGGTILVHSTVSIDLCRELEEAGRAVGVTVLDAPVSGSRPGAIRGTLTVMVGGERSAFDAALPVLRAFGQRVEYLGTIGSGQKMKLVNNVLVYVNLRTAYQAVLTAERLGLAPDASRAVLQAATARSPAMTSLLNKLTIDPVQARHSLKMIVKDTQLLQAACAAAEIPRSILDDLAEACARMVDQGFSVEALRQDPIPL